MMIRLVHSGFTVVATEATVTVNKYWYFIFKIVLSNS